MKNYKLGDMELEFANLIWENEPISSGGLVQLCEQKFSWKKSTTYTMLKRLCDKGIFQNNSGNVVSVLSKQEWFTKQSEGFVEETFNGSLPQFLVAFTRRKKLSKQEIAEIQKSSTKMQRNDYERQSISRYCKYEYYGQLCYLNYYTGTVAAEKSSKGFLLRIMVCCLFPSACTRFL